MIARRRGVEIEEIDLWLLGGVSRMKGYPKTAGDELRFAIAGPAVTLVIAAAFGALALALPSSSPAALRAVVEYQVLINAVILAFNLLPAFPAGRRPRRQGADLGPDRRPLPGHRDRRLDRARLRLRR